MSWRVYVLLAHDPATGCATAAVGVLGLMPGESAPAGGEYVSWIPFADGDRWRERIETTTAPMADAVAAWMEMADGITWDIVELEAPTSPDLRGSVEMTVDELLVTLAVPAAGVS
jgi:hypothetical protein